MALSREDADVIMAHLGRMLGRHGLAEWHVAITDSISEFGIYLLDDPAVYDSDAERVLAVYLGQLLGLLAPMKGQDLRRPLAQRLDISADAFSLRFANADEEVWPVSELDASQAPDFRAVTERIYSLLASLDMPPPAMREHYSSTRPRL